jgi:hypothetical protein
MCLRGSDATGLADPDVAVSAPGRLRGFWPSPTLTEATIEFDLPHDGPARLQLFDASGRHIRTLVDRVLSAGTHRVQWDGCDDRGVPTEPGAFYCRLQAAGVTESRPVVVIRR